MRIPRIFQPAPLAPGQTLQLAEDGGNHVGRVLRLGPGAPLVLFDGEGGEYPAEVCTVHRNRVDVRILGHEAREAESPLPVTLIQGVSRAERMDYTIQKAVELGVHSIVPVTTERSVVNLSGPRREKRREHWQKVARSACEQCGRNRIPLIAPVVTLAEGFEGLDAESTRLVLAHRASTTVAELRPSHSVVLLVGPEGGLSEQELSRASQSGFLGLRLGPRILRTETAALVALSILQARWGDLGQ